MNPCFKNGFAWILSCVAAASGGDGVRHTPSLTRMPYLYVCASIGTVENKPLHGEAYDCIDMRCSSTRL